MRATSTPSATHWSLAMTYFSALGPAVFAALTAAHQHAAVGKNGRGEVLAREVAVGHPGPHGGHVASRRVGMERPPAARAVAAVSFVQEHGAVVEEEPRASVAAQ